MLKHLNSRAVLLAGVSVFVLGGAVGAQANTVSWGASAKTPEVVTAEPEARSKKSKASKSRKKSRASRFEYPPAVEAKPRVAAKQVIEVTPAAEAKPVTVRRETTGSSVQIIRDEPVASQPARRSKASKKAEKVEDKIATAVPTGTLHVIVSIDQQRATLYSNGQPVASTKVSTGTATHPTPMGVFTVIQKNRHHVSNLYHAPMPYMQRLTWSGTAMHTGALPGYPASHGCVRLTDNFAQLLWKATKIGARVIVTKDDVKPVEFAHPKLPVPRPQVAQQPAAKPAETTGAPVRTADATGSVTAPIVRVAERPADPADPAAEPALDPRIMAIEAMPSSKEIERRNSPVSIFVSRKDGKLYVRQAMQPLFDVPVSLRDPEQPIGTHVYTAMELKDGAMRWTSVTVPSGFRLEPEKNIRRGKNVAPAAPAVQLPPSNAAAALERFDMPPEAAERLAAMLVPGSSLIVSDNGIGGETGTYTDFIVLTR